VCNFSSHRDDYNEECKTAIKNHCLHRDKNIQVYQEDEPACSCFQSELIDTDDGNCEFHVLSDLNRSYLKQGVEEGRNGKGIIFVWSSGNYYYLGEYSPFKGWLSSRYTIAVGSIDVNGFHASYSTPGPGVFVTAPGGDEESALIAPFPINDCAKNATGTSFAAPIVSGAIALMLEVNYDLGWRDVQGILATTSKKGPSNTPNDHTIQQNGAGLWHSDLYGFGILDINKAVTAAEQWVNFGPEIMLSGSSNEDLNLSIDDNLGAPVSSVISIKEDGMQGFVVENVVVFLTVNHNTRGHLRVILTAPTGMQSLLLPGKRSEIQQPEGEWELLTVRHWNELPYGDWTISVEDTKEGDHRSPLRGRRELDPTDLFKKWRIEIYGHAGQQHNPVVKESKGQKQKKAVKESKVAKKDDKKKEKAARHRK
jgi:subtilisin-like proprotein convertase family protein